MEFVVGGIAETRCSTLQAAAEIRAHHVLGRRKRAGLRCATTLCDHDALPPQVLTLDVSSQAPGPKWSVRQWCLYWRDRQVQPLQQLFASSLAGGSVYVAPARRLGSTGRVEHVVEHIYCRHVHPHVALRDASG